MSPGIGDIHAIRERWHTKNHPFFAALAEGKLPLRARRAPGGSVVAMVLPPLKGTAQRVRRRDHQEPVQRPKPASGLSTSFRVRPRPHVGMNQYRPSSLVVIDHR
jgi:hypothetical protein